MSDVTVAAATAELDRHRRLLRSGRDGRILSAIMLPMLWWTAPRGYGVLTTTGRRTGRQRSRCVRVIRRGDRAYLVALRPPAVTVAHPDWVNAWVHNIRADPAVVLRSGGHVVTGTAREVTDRAELDVARALLCEHVYPLDHGECLIHLRGWPSRTKIRELHSYWFRTGNPVAIDLKEPIS